MKGTVITTIIINIGVSASAVPKPDHVTPNITTRAPADGEPAVRWQDVTCDFGALTDQYGDPEKMWNDAQASMAWIDVVNSYNKEGRKKGASFGNWIGAYFDAPPNLSCGSISSSNCNTPKNCGQGSKENPPVNSPAGYMIVNSMVSLHIHFQVMIGGLDRAYDYIEGEIGTWTSTFQMQVDTAKKDKILLDMTAMLFSVVSGGAFNSWLKNVPYFKQEKNSDKLGYTQATLNGFVGQGLNILKESKTPIKELKAQNEMGSFLTQTVKNWVDTLHEQLRHLFEEEGAAHLFLNIVNGQAWDPEASKDAIDLSKPVAKALYAYMTPMAWKLSDPEVGVFIGTGYGVGAFERTYPNIDGKVLDAWRHCRDKTDYEPYWLVRIERTKKEYGDCNGPATTNMIYCDTPKVKEAPGIESLDGKRWGGLHWKELVESAVKAWKENGESNDWGSLDPSKEDDLGKLIEEGVMAKGMVNIPVCGFREALQNGYAGVKSDHWPCSR